MEYTVKLQSSSIIWAVIMMLDYLKKNRYISVDDALRHLRFMPLHNDE